MQPIMIDEPLPRFSWSVSHSDRAASQRSYHIIVSTVGGNQTTVWDSGAVASNDTVNIPYAGIALAADTDYEWTVTWVDQAGTTSPPAVGTFSTALFQIADWQGAAWVSGQGGVNTLQTSFNVQGVITRARLYIVGLGYYHAWVNGQAVGNYELGAFTTFETRILYDVHDVSAQIKTGCNVLGVMLGSGWYNQSSVAVGDKTLKVVISVTSDTDVTSYFVSSINGQSTQPRFESHTRLTAPKSNVASVQSLTFMSAPGPIVFDDIYYGEIYDARAYPTGWQVCGPTTGWLPVNAPTTTPTGVLSAHTVPIVIDQTFSSVGLWQVTPGVWVFDFGQVGCPMGVIR